MIGPRGNAGILDSDAFRHAVVRACGDGWRLGGAWPLRRLAVARCRGCDHRLWGRSSLYVVVQHAQHGTVGLEFCERCADGYR